MKVYAFQLDGKIPRFGNFTFVKFDGMTNMTKEKIIKEITKNGWSLISRAEYNAKMREYPSHIGQRRKYYVNNP